MFSYRILKACRARLRRLGQEEGHRSVGNVAGRCSATRCRAWIDRSCIAFNDSKATRKELTHGDHDDPQYRPGGKGTTAAPGCPAWSFNGGRGPRHPAI